MGRGVPPRPAVRRRPARNEPGSMPSIPRPLLLPWLRGARARWLMLDTVIRRGFARPLLLQAGGWRQHAPPPLQDAGSRQYLACTRGQSRP